jgi:L-lactate dehydrogenase complex protein LldG
MAPPGICKMNQAVSTREKILTAIRGARPKPESASTGTPRPELQLIPPPDDPEILVERFMLLAREEAATTEWVPEAADIPAAVLRYLHREQLGPRLITTGNARSAAIDWSSAAELDCVAGPVGTDGDTVVTGCYAGVAEAGAVVTLSSSDHPSEFNFLAATHIVIVQAAMVLGSFEELWSRLRTDYPENWPRMMNFIVGPSRTADLGVPSRLGAHGPSRVHIIVIRS